MKTRLLVNGGLGVLLVAAALMGLNACGSDSDSTPATAPTGNGISLSSVGVVTDKGSIYVNGVEFHTTSAGIYIDDSPGSDDGLKIGMFVKVKGEHTNDPNQAIAHEVYCADKVEGPIDSIDLAGNSLVAMGQTVHVDANTVFETPLTGLADLSPSEIVEVHGVFDQNGEIQATRIEREDGSSSEYEVKGILADLDIPPGSFTIGALQVDYSLAAANGRLPAGGLTEGAYVEAEGQLANGILMAREVELEDDHISVPEGEELEIEGVITRLDMTGDLPQCEINGQPVEIAANAEYKNCAPSDLVDGMMIEVEGAVNDAGVLIADHVEAKTESDSNS